MNVSRFVAAMPEPHRAELLVDLVPEITDCELQASLESAAGGKRSVLATFANWVPRNLALCLARRAEVAEGITHAELTRKSRMHLIDDLKRLRVPLSGTRGYAKAEVTSGGVATAEVDPKTMESRLAPGLYLAGEILDVDGPIGGYNFAWAWATGRAAGLGAAGTAK